MRFQDMAFAYAFAIFGDFYLAEDVAQDAFSVAWDKLSQLREPDAFPGWFKQIVRTQCNRLLRTKRLQFVPEDLIQNKVDPRSSVDSAERQELVRRTFNAISDLPENQRLVILLFYIGGYTQDDIGRFLNIPLSTVNKRIYTARQNLKDTLSELVKPDLDQHKPSRNDLFSNQVQARLRPSANSDWSQITKLAYRQIPGDPASQELWLKRRQDFVEQQYLRCQYVAENAKTKRIIGYGAFEQSIYLPRYDLLLIVSPRWLRQGVGELLLKQLLTDLTKNNAIAIVCHEYSSNHALIEFLMANGFDEINKQLDSRMYLDDVSTASLPNALKTIGKAGITISTLEAERPSDPEYGAKLYDLQVSLLRDIQGAVFSPPAYDAAEVRLSLEQPYVLPDGYFIARHSDAYVGVISVTRRESLPGGLTLTSMGVLPAYRKRGIGTALMLSAIEYSKVNGYSVLRTFSGISESSLLALNQKLGFKVEHELIKLERCLKDIVRIEDAILSDYAGTYRMKSVDASRDVEVRHQNGQLTIESIGQKVELFPTSETEFFIKSFYGEVTFRRDHLGGVRYLDYVEKHGAIVQRISGVKL